MNPGDILECKGTPWAAAGFRLVEAVTDKSVRTVECDASGNPVEGAKHHLIRKWRVPLDFVVRARS